MRIIDEAESERLFGEQGLRFEMCDYKEITEETLEAFDNMLEPYGLEVLQVENSGDYYMFAVFHRI